jgi:hypothetical protein
MYPGGTMNKLNFNSKYKINYNNFFSMVDEIGDLIKPTYLNQQSRQTPPSVLCGLIN